MERRQVNILRRRDSGISIVIKHLYCYKGVKHVKTKMRLISASLLCLFIASNLSLNCLAADDQDPKAVMQAVYGENEEISGKYDETLAALCQNGTFVGLKTGEVISFKGIPFAKQPVGPLRWKAPEAPDNSAAVYEAYYYGHAPIQDEWPTEVGSYYPQGEDCLNLNVWVNCSDSSTVKAVMVYIHGGSYGWGSTADPLFDGQNFVAENKDVILVTVGYRIGIMGFVDFSGIPGGEDYTESCNLGLLDQVQALRWIHENIAAFGGDPDNVTIFGESAGAGSVCLLPLMEGTEGLFSRVIAESGSVALTYSKEECQPLTEMILKDTGAASMDDLLALSAEELASYNEMWCDYLNFPMRDGDILPEDLYEAYENGAGSDLDWIIGTNANESNYWIGEVGGELAYRLLWPTLYENVVQRFSKEDQNLAEDFMALVSGEQYVWRCSSFFTELMFRAPAAAMAEALSSQGANVYMYYWEYPSSIRHYGACHAVELTSVFNNPQVAIYNGTNYDQSLASTTRALWTSFAKTGVPEAHQVQWPVYNQERQTLILNTEIRATGEPLSERRQLVTPLLKYHYNGNYADVSFAVPYIFKLCAAIVAALLIVFTLTVTIIKRGKKRRSKNIRQM